MYILWFVMAKSLQLQSSLYGGNFDGTGHNKIAVTVVITYENDQTVCENNCASCETHLKEKKRTKRAGVHFMVLFFNALFGKNFWWVNLF